MIAPRKRARRIVYAAAVLVSAAAFTPLVIPAGVAAPWVLGMPRTMWAGILVTVALVYLTYLAARYAPTEPDDPDAEPPPATNPSRPT